MFDIDLSDANALQTEEGARNGGLGSYIFGNLSLPSGRIAALDPIAPFGERPFVKTVAAGIYPVSITRRSELISIWFSDKPAVQWEPAVFESGGEILRHDGVCGYTVNSGTGCFVDSDAAVDLTTLLSENEWLGFVWFLEGARHLFYIDFSDPNFVELLQRLVAVERSIRRICGWHETMSGKEGGAPIVGIQDHLGYVRGDDPTIQAELHPFDLEKEAILKSLNDWTEANAFNHRNQALLTIWNRVAGEQRESIFSNFKFITFPDGWRNAAVFQTGYGDGDYPSFWGYDSEGAICRLTTDFEGHWLPEPGDIEG